MNQTPSGRSGKSSRRDFLKNTSTVAGSLAAGLSLSSAVHAAGSDVLRVGLIGCGGRGTGAAVQALMADPNTKVVALGDTFADQVEKSLAYLKRNQEVAARVEVPKERCFVGFQAYQDVIASGVDVVLLAAPPHFRPAHLKAAVDAGKHIFAEKPIAVDAPGVRQVLTSCQEAKKKNLAVVSGLCWRYDFGARATIGQVHEGNIGDLVTVQTTYNAAPPGKPWPMVRKSGWSDMEWQMRNWYWFNWLSGDHIVEQAVHSIDKGAWAVRDQPPVAATSLGGLQVRTGPERGQIYDHHAVVFEYASGMRHFHFCRQQRGCANDVSTYLFGTKGSGHVESNTIKDFSGKQLWKFRGERNVMHQTEHDELFAGLRKGKIINDGEFMCNSTMMAILGRMASYTGQKITWDKALNSKEDLTPAKYEWGALPEPAVALPGITKFS